MYGAIIGYHEELSLYEMAFCGIKNINNIRHHIITFEAEYPDHIRQCASCIKSWKVVNKEEMHQIAAQHKIIGTTDKQLGKSLKEKHSGIKRFKEVELLRTDKDIKENGKEIIPLWSARQEEWDEDGEKLFLIIEHHQNIPLYETIDFEKPVRGMEIGMMPAKLTMVLLNCWLASLLQQWKKINGTTTVYDPFTGFGTTNMVVNSRWLATIGSDSTITAAKRNMQRRKDNKFAQDVPLTVFKHDVHQPFTKPFIKNTSLIVSEWRLGPVTTKRTQTEHVEANITKIIAVYTDFFQHCQDFFGDQLPVIVITFPEFLFHEISIQQQIEESLKKIDRKYTILEEPYARKHQVIGRKILIVG